MTILFLHSYRRRKRVSDRHSYVCHSCHSWTISELLIADLQKVARNLQPDLSGWFGLVRRCLCAFHFLSPTSTAFQRPNHWRIWDNKICAWHLSVSLCEGKSQVSPRQPVKEQGTQLGRLKIIGGEPVGHTMTKAHARDQKN
jgi:hypothetical protein